MLISIKRYVLTMGFPMLPLWGRFNFWAGRSLLAGSDKNALQTSAHCLSVYYFGMPFCLFLLVNLYFCFWNGLEQNRIEQNRIFISLNQFIHYRAYDFCMYVLEKLKHLQTTQFAFVIFLSEQGTHANFFLSNSLLRLNCLGILYVSILPAVR